MTGWGFSALVEKGSLKIMVDTGWEVDKLQHNMAEMGWQPKDITHIIISHWHPDHYTGLRYLLKKNNSIQVFLPKDHSFKNSNNIQIKTVDGHLKIADDVFVLQTIPRKSGGGIKDELTLAVFTSEGPALVSGCFHTGWPEMIKKVGELSEKKPYLMVGGGRFIDNTESELNDIAGELQRLGLKNVGLAHCAAGSLPEKVFVKYFPDHLIKAKLGEVINIP